MRNPRRHAHLHGRETFGGGGCFLAAEREALEAIVKILRPFALAALPAALLACSGGVADPAFVAATPSYAALSMDQTALDATTPTALSTDATSAALMTAGSPCHPHLFVRTHEVVARVNRHLFKFLRRVEDAIADNPEVASATTHEWQRTWMDRTTVRFTMTRDGDVFTWKLDVAPSGGGFVPVFWGRIDRTGATGPHQGKGSMTLDLTALHGVVPTEHATGVVDADFETTAASRKLVVDAADVAWEIDPVMPDGSMMSAPVEAALEAPRSAHYVYFREPGVGGSLKIADDMVFLCPANPSAKLAEVNLVQRWFRLGDGSVHGRTDARMTGGQLPDHVPAIGQVVGVTCHASGTETGMPVESYWLLKSEDANGATIVGSDTTVDGGGASTLCDPMLNQAGLPTATPIVPNLNDGSTDFGFSTVSFADDVPYPFPNMR